MKTVEELTMKEILEDMRYYLDLCNMKSPSWLDGDFQILRVYIDELEKRNEVDK